MNRTYIASLALLFGGNFCAMPAVSAEKTMYAPIDGFVLTIPFEQSVHAKQRTPAQYLYDQARVMSELEALYFKDMDLRWKSDDLVMRHLNDFKVPPEVANAPPVLSISADLLEIQFQQELIKFRTAQERYRFAKQRFDLEVSLQEDVRLRLRKTEEYKADVAREAYNRNRFTINKNGEQKACGSASAYKDCIGPDGASRMLNNNQERSKAEVNVSEKRSDIELEQFRQAVELARNELESSKKSLLAIAATIKLGSISCPVRCKVGDVFVVPGQYVNKGDRLFTFTWLKEPE